MDELTRIASDPRYPGMDRVLQVLASLPDGAKLQFLLSRRGSLGGRCVLEALSARQLDAVLAAAQAYVEG